MKIACLSGKGGAGKTFVAVNLAYTAGEATYIDCDVEEPNGRLFWKPEQVSSQTVSTLLPEFDAEKCTGCKACVQFCRFHALMYIREKPMVFSEVCHSCGGCQLVCSTGAISEKPKPIGVLETGRSGQVQVISGILNPGEASGVPLIRRALQEATGLSVLDCPPGSACSVMETVQAADVCLLVAEPTAFGFHNFQMVHELCTLLKKPCAVVINKQSSPYQPLEDYCQTHRLPILARIPYDRELAERTAQGIVVSAVRQDVWHLFRDVLTKAGGMV